MATANQAAPGGPIPWAKVFLTLLAVGGCGALLFGDSIAGYAAAGTGYGARNACSCRYISGRPLGDCREDFVPGMEAVLLTQDEDRRSVTAYIPLLHSETARFREGFGCVLEPQTS